jgi:hypothetical protein
MGLMAKRGERHRRQAGGGVIIDAVWHEVLTVEAVRPLRKEKRPRIKWGLVLWLLPFTVYFGFGSKYCIEDIVSNGLPGRGLGVIGMAAFNALALYATSAFLLMFVICFMCLIGLVTRARWMQE